MKSQKRVIVKATRIHFSDLINQKVAHQEVIYKTIGEVSLRILIVKPDEWENTIERTALVWIHGGGWERGEPEIFLAHSYYFASRGAVSFNVEYRLIGNNSSILTDCMADVKSAMRYIRKLRSGQPPILNLQGKLDVIVKPEITIKFHEDNLSVGNLSKLILFPEAEHAFMVLNYTATDEQIVNAILAMDNYLISMKFLSGVPCLEV
jgi:hypothetical protein